MSLLEKTQNLPEPIRAFFWSDEPRFLCEDICFQYGISNDYVGDVTWFVAPLLTKSLPLANLPQELRAKFPKLTEDLVFGLAFELNQKLLQKFPEQFPEAKILLSEWRQKKSSPRLSEQEAHKKTLEIESWYLEWKRENEQEEALAPQKELRQTVSLPLLDALSKYQRLSEQIVTEDRIAVKGESAPVRGSIRNWLRHYRDAVGIRKHSTMERGQFLFQGENTRRLSSAERGRVSFILKSLDEGFPVPIDADRQEVVFPVIEEKENSVSGTASNAVAPVLETSFRPLEKFPAQAAPIRKALEWSMKDDRENSRHEKSSELSTPFGIVPQGSSREAEKPQAIGVSTPAYAPVSPSAISEPPFSPQGNMSFSSSHVLPHEKAIEEAKTLSEGVSSSVRKSPSASAPENSRDPEAISVIRPYLGSHKGAGKEMAASSEGSSDAPRVVNLRSSGGRNARGRV